MADANLFQNLPNEIIEEIFLRTAPHDLISISKTCQRMQEIGTSESLWRIKCKNSGADICCLPVVTRNLNLNQLQKYQKTMFRHHELSSDPFINHFSVASDFKLKSNSMTYKIFNDEVVSYLVDDSFKIYKLSTGELLKSFPSSCLKFEDFKVTKTKIVCLSNERRLFVWDKELGNVSAVLNDYNYPYTCFDVNNKKVIGGSILGWNTVWDINSGKKLMEMKEFSGRTTHMKFVEGLVASATEGKIVTVLDTDNGKAICRIDIKNHIEFMEFNGIHLVIQTLRGCAMVYDVSTGQCTKVLSGFTLFDNNLKLHRKIALKSRSEFKTYDLFTQEMKTFPKMDKLDINDLGSPNFTDNEEKLSYIVQKLYEAEVLNNMGDMGSLQKALLVALWASKGSTKLIDLYRIAFNDRFYHLFLEKFNSF